MGYLLQPMTFTRLDQVKACTFGYPEKIAVPPSVLSLSLWFPHYKPEVGLLLPIP